MRLIILLEEKSKKDLENELRSNPMKKLGSVTSLTHQDPGLRLLFRYGNLFLLIVNLVWLITASCTIYPMNKSDCNQTLYWFMFWYLTTLYIILGSFVSIGVILILLAALALHILGKWTKKDLERMLENDMY